jgi:hypothetical protein
MRILLEGTGSFMSHDQIFISYSSRDKDWAEAFAKSLRSKGLTVWLDQDQIRVGDSINDAIERGLRESSYVLSVLTPETINKPNLLFEMGAALGMRRRSFRLFRQTLIYPHFHSRCGAGDT